MYEAYNGIDVENENYLVIHAILEIIAQSNAKARCVMVDTGKNDILIEYLNSKGQLESVTARDEGEGTYRLPKRFLANHPSIRAILPKDETLNNVWIVGEEWIDEMIKRGTGVLNVRVRVSRKGLFGIVATTISLGAIVAVKVISRSHKDR